MASPPDRVDDTTFAEIQRRINANHPNVLTSPVGESVYDRTTVATGTAATTQALRLMGFTAKATQNITRVRVVTGSTAAGATPTLCRIGVYSRDSANLYTLIASTANDTALFSAASTTYTPSFSAAFQKTAGVDYLVGILIVSAAAFPTFMAPVATTAGVAAYNTDVFMAFPQLTANLAGQADLPATMTAASLTNVGTYAHALLLQ